MGTSTYKFLVIVVVVFIAIVSYLVMNGKQEYELKYFEKTGITSHLYNQIVSEKGKLIDEEIVYEKNVAILKLYYKGYIYCFIGINPLDKSNAVLSNVRITDTDYKLGKYNVGVGSSKKDVEKSYRQIKKISNVDLGYIDNGVWVEFKFDENEKVQEILIYRGP